MAAAALLSPPPSPSPSPSPSSLHPRHALRFAVGTGGGGRARATSTGTRRRAALVPCSSSVSARGPASGGDGLALERRRLLLSGLVSSLALVLPVSDSHAVAEMDEDVKMATLVDPINAYSFLYPVELPGKKFTFKWVESRKPERYSSAAPLSPDARQRIVSERVDMIHNVVISVSIGPPNSRFPPSKDKSKWDPKDVADWILAEKSSLVDGEPYWYYEYLVRKSPTQSAPEPNLFRHNVACTAERDGYLYSLNASTLSKQWGLLYRKQWHPFTSYPLQKIMFLHTRIHGDFGDIAILFLLLLFHVLGDLGTSGFRTYFPVMDASVMSALSVLQNEA
uniref:PsbP C-terminal domain-containing protein n=1 Tax=Oryza meridionalis TaxID=40149 RepID=A0A0E0C4N7_9ORYZ